MKTITKLEQQKKRTDRVSVFLDGVFFCGVPESLIAKLDLFPGKSINENEIARLIHTKLVEEAKQKILRLLNRRMYTEQEIVEKLKAKGYDQDTIDPVVTELKAISMIDDLSFANAFVSDRLRLKPLGSFRIAYELRKKGVSQKIIDRVLSDTKVAEHDEERALEIAQKRLQSLSSIVDSKVKKRRLYHFLLRRGFSYTVIHQVIDKIFEKKLDNQDVIH